MTKLEILIIELSRIATAIDLGSWCGAKESAVYILEQLEKADKDNG